MTRDKAQKQAIRARMTRTGERYTTARRYALDLHHPESSPDAPALIVPLRLERDLARIVADGAPVDDPPLAVALPPRVAEPGVSDATLRQATGKGWDEWFLLLDAWGGVHQGHRAIAQHVHEAYGIDGWWAQGVTVGYERARGLRALHERPDGFSVSVSKTIAVPAERLYAAVVDDRERARWLHGLELRRRTGQPHRSARFDVLPGETRLNATFTARGPEKATVALAHERLPSASDVEQWRAIWKEQLAALGRWVTG